ncbi:N5-carboxyaminoimidazole ribonucleotide synthase [Elysia marginata]|uniref:phosphoribosylaminoimidazole carboxylase n=1 Tax=Elysia marginata TaxID=1093978 RepID=A0AAV4FPM5_9GAST|nr:N5-carboxyaminoimidazole ribonucleotide synthase [Elysia marginata]
MLLYETNKWDIKTHVLDPSETSPCKYLCNYFQKGDLTDYDTVYQFGKGVETLTVEIEHVNIEALFQLEREGVEVYPQARILAIVQNKITQKQFYQAHNIPTVTFMNFNSKKDFEGKQAFPYIWKSALFGYDGKGVAVVKDSTAEARLPDVACVIENVVPIKKELAVIVARNLMGEIVTYPVVEMSFSNEASLVEFVISPARISEDTVKRATKIAVQVSKEMQHVGLLAVELFLTKNEEILVNEVAPRPHNSGHFSIEGSLTNQFEQHIRSVLKLPLGSTDIKTPAVMINLLGAKGFEGDAYYKNIEKILAVKGVTPHIYGKKQTHPFRKMGHITVVSPNLETAIETAKNVKKTIKVIASNKY